MPKVIIEIDQETYDCLREALKDVTLPPVREEGRIVTPLAYPNPVEDWIAEVVAGNVRNIVQHRPTPALKLIQDQVAALDKQTAAYFKPVVTKEPK